MYTEHKLAFFREMISCSYHFYFWTYDAEMHLLDTDCPNEMIFERIFELENFSDLILKRMDIADRPFILSTSFGLMWAVVFEAPEQPDTVHTVTPSSPLRDDKKSPSAPTRDDRESPAAPVIKPVSRIHIMGPAFITSFSYSTIEKKLNQYDISIAVKRSMLEQLRALPVIESNRLMQYVLMFHFCVRDEKITTEDFYYLTPLYEGLSIQYNEEGDDPLLPETKGMEQALLLAVEQGNLNYKHALSLSSIAASIKISEITSLRHYKYPTYRFISLCCDAACKGGLSRYIAYTLSNVYLETVDNCQTPSELKRIIDVMYEDYITRVHECRQRSALSAPLKTCRDYIDQNPTSDLSLETLAGLVGYTPYYLSKLFKKETGMSLNSYIKKARIEHAKLLLISQKDSIQQISEQLHFCSGSHFSETFFKEVGMMPREYRKKYS